MAGNGAGENIESLKITIGEATVLSSLVYQNTASLAVSRTGVVAAFYPKPGTGPKFYRVSTDAGRTWGKEMEGPDIWGGAEGTALPDGGVIKLQGGTIPIEGKDEWYDVKTFRFIDDFTRWETEIAKMYVPNNISLLSHVHTPHPAKGKIIQMPDGALLMPMYGRFRGDIDLARAYLARSTDQGGTWRYYATVAYEPVDPNPELPGQYVGSDEPSIALLANGQLLAMLRTQYSHYPAEYRPMYVCWSSDLGKTWTRPIPTNPHLMNISPTLVVLDNGVVACEYGRPGFHVAFSTDNGYTWKNRTSFSHWHEPIITGQCDMIKAGPNRLLAIGSDRKGVKVWPITVERVKVSPARVDLTGSVIDEQGEPIAGAKVERSPNRYAADTWIEGSKLDAWKSGPVLVRPPELGYRSIRRKNGSPTVKTNHEGRFQFNKVKLGEYVLTVEAEGYAPQHRHINLAPETKPQDFCLKAGQKIRNRVMDNTGQPVGGACVVLNR